MKGELKIYRSILLRAKNERALDVTDEHVAISKYLTAEDARQLRTDGSLDESRISELASCASSNLETACHAVAHFSSWLKSLAPNLEQFGVFTKVVDDGTEIVFNKDTRKQDGNEN